MKTITRFVLLLFVLFVAFSAGHVRANDAGPGSSNPYNKFSFGLGGGMFTSLTDVKELPLFPDPDEITYGGSLFSLSEHPARGAYKSDAPSISGSLPCIR